MTDCLHSRDIRALFQLLGQLRELGADPAAWRSHLVGTLAGLCGATVAVVTELRVDPEVAAASSNCSEVVRPLQAIDHGLAPARRERFYRELYFTDHDTDDALEAIVPLYGSRFTILRGDVVDDRRWDRSYVANERFRPFDCDDFVMSMVPVSALGVVSSLELYRGRGAGFTPRERLVVQLLHEELSRDWSRGQPHAPRLTPRQRQVLAQLAQGASEKELAQVLGMSAHTAHDHVKALHRAYGVRSRGELLAKLAPPRPRTQLLAESA
jgi:DNA-binding CsgD family transcriptional regulator